MLWPDLETWPVVPSECPGVPRPDCGLQWIDSWESRRPRADYSLMGSQVEAWRTVSTSASQSGPLPTAGQSCALGHYESLGGGKPFDLRHVSVCQVEAIWHVFCFLFPQVRLDMFAAQTEIIQCISICLYSVIITLFNEQSLNHSGFCDALHFFQ